MVDFAIRVVVDPSGASRGNQSVRRDLRRTEQAADRLSRSIRRAFGAIGGALAIRRLVQFADQFATLENQVRVVSNNTDQLSASLDRLFQIANRTRAPVGALGTLFQRASIASSELGASQSQLFDFVERVGQALAVQGSTVQSARGALIQLSQAIGSTIVRAEEFNSIQEGALPILQAVARGIDDAGGSVSRLRSLVINGQVTNREFFDAFLRGSDQISDQFGATRATVGQALTQLNNAFVETVGRLSRTSGAMNELVETLQNFANIVRSDFFKVPLNILFEGFSRTAEAVQRLTTFLKDPSLQRFLGVGEVLIDGAPTPAEAQTPGLAPPSSSPANQISADLQKQIDKAKEFSTEVELQNQLIFAQLQGNDSLARQLQVRLELESAISKEVRDARPDIANAVRRQLEEQQELQRALERGRQIQEDFRTVTQDAFETFVAGARRGKLSIDDLFNSILDNLIRLQTNRIFDQLFGTGPGNSGALGANFTNLLGGNGSGGFSLGNLFRFNDGGSFTVGGMPGIDRNVLSVNGQGVGAVSRGERVNITPAAQTVPAQSAPNITLNLINEGRPQMEGRVTNTRSDGKGGVTTDVILSVVEDGLARGELNKGLEAAGVGGRSGIVR